MFYHEKRDNLDQSNCKRDRKGNSIKILYLGELGVDLNSCLAIGNGFLPILEMVVHDGA